MIRRGILTMAVLGLIAAPLAAQQSNDELKKELESLRKEVDGLKQKQAELQTREVPADAVTNRAPGMEADRMAAPQDLSPLQTLLKESKISGFVDAGYIINADSPNNDLNGNLPGSTPLRVFDRKASSFYLHNAQINLERTATKDMIAGYRIELSTGSDADVFQASGAAATDNFDIQEGYVQILLPFGNGIDLKVGKMATLAGYEVIESKDNMNYSRGILFGWAIPFTHTGVRGTYAFNDQYSMTLGVHNGWDDLSNRNNANTAEFQFVAKPIENLALYANVYYGAEQANEDGNKRFLIDLIATYTYGALTLALNVDMGKEEFDEDEPPVTSEEDTPWNGWAAYAKYQVNDMVAPSIRFERFRDEEGGRTGDRVNFWEVTGTIQFNVSSNLIVRVEWRHDKASEDLFLDHTDAEDSQDTFGAEVIVIF